MATGILFIALSLHSAPGRGATASSSRPLTLSTGGDGLTEGFKGRSLSPLLRQFYPCISLQKLVERIPLPRSCLSFVRISFVSFPVVENVFVILLLLGDRGTIPSKQIERDVVRYNIVRPVHALLRIRPTFHTSNARMPIRPNPFATGFAKRNSWRNIVSSSRTLHAKLTNNWTGESSPLSSSSLDSV